MKIDDALRWLRADILAADDQDSLEGVFQAEKTAIKTLEFVEKLQKEIQTSDKDSILDFIHTQLEQLEED